MSVSTPAAVIKRCGYVYLAGPLADLPSAWKVAEEIAQTAAIHDPLAAEMPTLEVVGEFNIPAPDSPSRNFQALHVDFGIPLGGAEALDVARYTALHIEIGRQRSGAITRIVSLDALWQQRPWPAPSVIGQGIGTAEAEGVLARVIEGADGSRDLPRKTPGFLCGMEFTSQDDETAFYQAHGLDLSLAENAVVIEPGGLLVFDNMRCAHGRTGTRSVGELHQRCLGYRSLSPFQQVLCRDLVLGRLS